MGGRGSTGSGKTGTTKSVDELKSDRKRLAEEYLDFVNSHSDEDGVMDNSQDIEKTLKLQKQLDSVEYELFRQLTPVVKQESWKGEGITDLTRDEAVTVRKDMVKNKEMYMAIASAAHGVSYSNTTDDTAVDTFYGKNPDRAYKVFEPTRKMLRKKYGDTVTLYRVPTSQTAKATVNMTSTRSNAEQYAKQYGRKVETVKVPVKDILAVNVARSGRYEEFIVLNKKRK